MVQQLMQVNKRESYSHMIQTVPVITASYNIQFHPAHRYILDPLVPNDIVGNDYIVNQNHTNEIQNQSNLII